jgi:putative transcriptional regulator
MHPMTEAEAKAAAKADPDARPMTPAELARAQRVPRVKTLRRAPGFTQEEFSLRYQIPIGTLRDWEQGRTEPDQPARTYLKVIARDPGFRSRSDSSPDTATLKLSLDGNARRYRATQCLLYHLRGGGPSGCRCNMTQRMGNNTLTSDGRARV